MDKGLTNQPMTTKIGEQVYDMPRSAGGTMLGQGSQNVFTQQPLLGQETMGQRMGEQISGTQMGTNMGLMGQQQPGLIGRMEQGINETLGTNLGNLGTGQGTNIQTNIPKKFY